MIPNLGLPPTYEVEGSLPTFDVLRAWCRHQDLYIIEGAWDWSFVMTHEDTGPRIGPFFVEATDVAASA